MRPTMLPVVAAVLLCVGPGAADGFRFASIDGGEIDLAAFHGQPVLVVNTASQCGFTPQYDGLQALQDRYGPRGLVVLAVPSDDFKQELADEAAVKEFCEVNFGLTLPMTEITHVKGPEAHPFYRWMAEAHGFTPGWNFNKVLLDGEGHPVATYGAFTTPKSAELTARIESLLPE
ncbi:glutathione peroxidase [Rhodovulum kholense]|uniref:Glutathione peroxidase n=1 Tax=Rhodovulum kholense TaxID=453584 RepID=A0A8E2VK27_9RHOB|nr:glutathione peroxidase [Rhodovulum kholense]PTW49755.1 glutathione peroxidase [Rhodovulum kholense]